MHSFILHAVEAALAPPLAQAAGGAAVVPLADASLAQFQRAAKQRFLAVLHSPNRKKPLRQKYLRTIPMRFGELRQPALDLSVLILSVRRRLLPANRCCSVFPLLMESVQKPLRPLP